jgi:4-hydroxy-tetrahydrodipicolinate synthase
MSKKPEWLQGIFPAVVTPFRKDDRINEQAYREILRFMLPHVNGIVTCGTTGEFIYLSREEKLRVLEITLEECRDSCPVIMGTAYPSTWETFEFTSEVRKRGANAALVAAPYFMPPSFNEVYEHYEKLDEIGIPLILYNIPQCTGTHFRWWTAEGLAKLDNVAAIKDTSGDMPFLEAMLEKVRGEVAILVGHDEIVTAALAAGADGAILSSGNIIPDIWQEIYQAVRAGDLGKAQKLQAQNQKLARIVARTGATQAAKEGLRIMGYNAGDSRKPIMRGGSFRREDYEEVRSHLLSLGKVPTKKVVFDLAEVGSFEVDYPAVAETPDRIAGFTLKTGEAFSGPPFHEVAHIDLMIGLKGGPVDRAVEEALARPDEKSKPRLVSTSPKLMVVPTVTIRTNRQESHLFGDAKEGVLQAVQDALDAGELPKELAQHIVIVANVFVHPGASIRYRIRFNNYKAMRAAIRRTLESRPTLDELKGDSVAFRHPFRYAP